MVFFMLCCFSVRGWTAGFSLMLKGIKGLGNSFAAGAAFAEDASTIYYNPAGLVRVSDNQVLIYGQTVTPSFVFSDRGSKTVLDQDLTGGDGGDGGTFNFLPGGFYSQTIGDRWAVGVGIVSPFGLASDYDATWKGRYHALKSRLFTVDINPTVSYRINEKVSIGVGLSAQYANAELSQAIDYGTINADLLGGLLPIDPQGADGKVKLTADGWGFGYNCGIMYSLNENLRFGLSYRSKISYVLKGKADFSVPESASLIASGAKHVDTGGRTKVDMPGNISISGFYQINNRWAVMGDINWTHWDVLDELHIQFDSGAQENVLAYHWKNALRYALGTTYTPNESLAFRMGLALEETPVPNDRYRIPQIPDEDRFWFSVGTGYRFSDRVTMDIGYSYLLGREADIDKSAEGYDRYRGALKGTFEGHSNVFGAQVIWSF